MGVKAWITVRGNHIPIMDGESKTQALGNFFKSKRTARNKKIKDEAEYNRQVRNRNLDSRYNAEFRVRPTKDWDKLKKSLNEDLKTSNEQYKKDIEANKRNIKGRAKTVEELDNLRKDYKERSKDNWYSDTDRKHFAEKARQIAKKEVNNYDIKSYKLKEDRIKKTPVSSINVDTYSYRSAHGKEPGSVRVGGSSRGNWAFKLGNETVFINDTYSNAKRKAVKEASRRGLTSIKVLS